MPSSTVGGSEEGHSDAPAEHTYLAEHIPQTSSEPPSSTVAEHATSSEPTNSVVAEHATSSEPTSATATEHEVPQQVTSDGVTEEETSQKRLSSYSFSNLPEVVPSATYEGLHPVPREIPQGLHPVGAETYEGLQNAPTSPDPRKSVASTSVQAEHYEEGRGSVPSTVEPYAHGWWLNHSDEKPQPVKGWKERLNRKIYRVRTKWLLLGALLLVLIIALGAGLGAGLSSGKSKNPQDQPSGALNGTRIALATQVLAGDTNETLVMYFQHRTGQIRYMTFVNGQWTGGDASTVFANNAKMNTPITAVSYVWGATTFWRVFYVDVTNTIVEVWGATNTEGWELGYLTTGNYGLTPMDGDEVGMVVCWDGPSLQETYANGYGSLGDAPPVDLTWRLVYASNETTFQQIAYHGDTQLYTSQETLTNLNGHVSPACYNQGSGTVDYLMTLDLQDQINVYWKDTNTSQPNTTSHPINKWTEASVAIPNIEKAGTLGYTKYLYSQDQSDQLISAYNLSLEAENTTLITGSRFTVEGQPALSNTGLAVTSRPNPAGGDDVIALYQTDGSHIGYFERDADGISWNSALLVIPYD